MLVENADVDLPMFVEFIGDACARQNVEREILSLRSAHVRMTVDPTEAEPARKVWNEPPVRPDKIVTAAEVHAEVMVLHAANNRFRHEGETKLIVAPGPTPNAFGAVVHAPPDASGDELRSNLIAVGISDYAKQVTGLHGDFESRRIKRFSCGS